MCKPVIFFVFGAILSLSILGIGISTGPGRTEASSSDWTVSISFPAEELSLPRGSCPDNAHCWVINTGAKSTLNIMTADGGNTWSPWTVPGLDPVFHMAFFNGTLGYAGNDGINGGPAGLARTTDGGKSWIILTNRPAWAIHPVNANVVYIDSEDGAYKSVDAGTTWRKVTSDRLPEKVQFVDESSAWAVFSQYLTNENKYLAFTSDEGKTWTKVDPDPGVRRGYLSAFFRDARNGWVCGQGRTLFSTTDGGVTWTLVGSAIGAYCDGKMLFLDVSHGVISGGGSTISRTNDGGKSWSEDLTSYGPLEFISFQDFDHGWAVSTGKVLRRAPGLALTPTPVPVRTPAPGPTPILIPTRTPTVIPQPACSWDGQWSTMAGGEPFQLSLSQSSAGIGGAAVLGNYGADGRKIEGSVSGSTLTGRWSAPPSFLEPDHAGRLVFTLAADCNSFSGSWGFGAASSGGGSWNGARLTGDAARAALVRDAYRATLCRDPDAGGLAYWAGAGLDRAGLEAQLLASGEGQLLWGVRLAYLSVLARDPIYGDCLGLRYWASTGLSSAAIAVLLQDTPEGGRVRAIRDLYIELLGRDPLGPDNLALRGWVDSGFTLEQIRGAIMASDEYRRRTA